MLKAAETSTIVILLGVLSAPCLVSGCVDSPVPTNQGPAPGAADVANMRTTDLRLQGGVLGTAAQTFGVELPQVCMIHHRHKWVENGVITGGPPAIPDTVFLGPDGRPQRITRDQCAQENEKSLAAEEEAYQQSVDTAQRAAQDAQQKRTAAVAQIIRDEEAHGYKHVTVRDLYLDGKSFAANGTKVAIPGFYKAKGRHDERLYSSYNDFMMHSFQSVEAVYVGLITENGSRNLRESLLNCAAGCNVTILGHVDRCLETNVFGATSRDFCLVAEDAGRPE
jgi:hypothetical protein